ncbi:MAG: DNA cytosine methyltransferase [Mesorhizobium sp.]|uniref:DNA cytosine methyltransferase n=1 Tax=Mesorhizobium sp. TaxID=1871066 RepID=UPI000FE5092C|nr:DNA cytosine methyltransferase [Mesorhizobium sp.]RWO34757.1 MAG: DNA cytosine methyltransferase [Mesorhizobium sp.]
MNRLKVLDLFSGIGGFSLGLERTGGFETVAFCEIEPFCRRELARLWPTVRQYHDVQTLTGAVLASDGITVDAICGGFPCQDISLAGNGEGIEGARSSLWRHYARLVGEIRPQFVIVENVAALLSRGHGDVLGDLAALGYDAEWHCVPAAYVGARHIRDRVWIVAVPTGQRQNARPYVDAELLERFRESCAAWGEDRFIPGTELRDDWTPPDSLFEPLDDGLPERLDWLGAFGNAVVPQIPELIGRAILQARAAA